MPAPIQVKINSKIYTTPILTGEMDTLAQQIQSVKDDIALLNFRLNEKLTDLNTLNQQFMAAYISQTGSFPP
jgi:adenine specific DNA methylase Mod